MRRCESCGGEIPVEGAGLCPECGAELNALGVSSPSHKTPTTPPGPPGSPATGPVIPPGTQPVPGAPPPPPRKKGLSKGWKIGLLVGGILLAVIVAVIALVLVFVVKEVIKPADAVNDYIGAINRGEAAQAWDLLTEDSEIGTGSSFDDFKERIVDPYENALETWNVSEVNISGERANVSVDMKFKDGEEMKVKFMLEKRGGNWKITEYE